MDIQNIQIGDLYRHSDVEVIALVTDIIIDDVLYITYSDNKKHLHDVSKRIRKYKFAYIYSPIEP